MHLFYEGGDCEFCHQTSCFAPFKISIEGQCAQSLKPLFSLQSQESEKNNFLVSYKHLRFVMKMLFVNTESSYLLLELMVLYKCSIIFTLI